MRKRVKDFAYTVKVPKETLINLAEQLDKNENDYYRNWDEPKLDSEGNKRYDENGLLLTRPICAPIFKLKQIQRKILRNVLYKLDLPNYYFGGVGGKDAVLNARYHQGNKYFFLTDLKNFFPSIKHTTLEKVLREEGFYPDVSRLITRLCTSGGCIPQGCPTSSFLASLVLKNSCSEIFEELNQQGLKVSVYVDDITFSSPKDFKNQAFQIIQDLRSKGLKINFEKTHYCSYNPIVTGVQVKNNAICALPYTYQSALNESLSIRSRIGHLQRIQYINRIAKN